MDIKEITTEAINAVEEFAADEVKNTFLEWLRDTAMPAAKEFTTAYVAKLREQAATETGWNKVRDMIFLPGVINGAIYVITKLIDKMIPTPAPAVAVTEATAQ